MKFKVDWHGLSETEATARNNGTLAWNTEWDCLKVSRKNGLNHEIYQVFGIMDIRDATSEWLEKYLPLPIFSVIVVSQR